jgi:hypothetical protein
MLSLIGCASVFHRWGGRGKKEKCRTVERGYKFLDNSFLGN